MLIPINSPCTGECKYNEEYLVCNSCYRTLHEIADWSYLTWQERDEIRLELEKRKVLIEGDVK